MEPSSEPNEAKSRQAELAASLQEHVDRVCLGAMETQQRPVDQAMLSAALQSLQIVRESAEQAGIAAIVEAAILVEQAFGLATVEGSAPVPYLGHLVTSAAADLLRVVQATASGVDPQPYLIHAGETVQSLSRLSSDLLVEVDLSDAEQVARFFQTVTDSPEEPVADDLQSSDNQTSESAPPMKRLPTLYEALRAAATSSTPDTGVDGDQGERPILRRSP